MRREQESRKKKEYIQGEEEQIAKGSNNIPAGCTGCTTAVAIFFLCTDHIPSDMTIHCLAEVCCSVERRERAVCCPRKAETEQAVLL
jgi:hypothetical protein